MKSLESEIAEKIDLIASRLAENANVLLVFHRAEEGDRHARKLFSRMRDLLTHLSTYIESEHGISVSLNALDLRPGLDGEDVTEHILDVVLRRSVISRGAVISSNDLRQQSLRDAVLGESL